MNVPETFERMRMSVACAMAIAKYHHRERDVAERMKRALVGRLASVEGARYSIMGERGGAGQYQIVCIWREGLLQPSHVGPLQAPVCVALVDALDNTVCHVLGEPVTGRMWSRSSLKQRELRRGVVIYVEGDAALPLVKVPADCDAVVVRGMPMTPVEFAAFRAKCGVQ